MQPEKQPFDIHKEIKKMPAAELKEFSDWLDKKFAPPTTQEPNIPGVIPKTPEEKANEEVQSWLGTLTKPSQGYIRIANEADLRTEEETKALEQAWAETTQTTPPNPTAVFKVLQARKAKENYTREIFKKRGDYVSWTEKENKHWNRLDNTATRAERKLDELLNPPKKELPSLPKANKVSQALRTSAEKLGSLLHRKQSRAEEQTAEQPAAQTPGQSTMQEALKEILKIAIEESREAKQTEPAQPAQPAQPATDSTSPTENRIADQQPELEEKLNSAESQEPTEITVYDKP